MASIETVVRLSARFIQIFPTGIWLVGLEDDPVATYTGSYELRKLEVRWSRTPTVGVVQDPAICTFHLINITSGTPDATWTDADYASVEARFDTWWTTNLNDFYKAETKLFEYVWRADGPAFKPFGSSLSPTLRITPKSIAGSNAGAFAMLPPQCACTVTEVVPSTYTAFGVGVPGSTPGTGRTQVRNRWGRFYMPPPSSQYLDDGRWANGFTDTLADDTKTLYDGLVTDQFIPVVYSPTTGSAWGVEEIHVDDIVDVIRSRRFETAIRRTPRTIAGV